MLGPLTLVTVRQQQDETAHAQPFSLARAEELVDNHLCAIGEVAELRLPQDKGGGVGEAVAVFEPDHRRFGKWAVDNLERRLPRADVIDRDIARFGLLVDQHGVAL